MRATPISNDYLLKHQNGHEIRTERPESKTKPKADGTCHEMAELFLVEVDDVGLARRRELVKVADVAVVVDATELDDTR